MGRVPVAATHSSTSRGRSATLPQDGGSSIGVSEAEAPDVAQEVLVGVRGIVGPKGRAKPSGYRPDLRFVFEAEIDMGPSD